MSAVSTTVRAAPRSRRLQAAGRVAADIRRHILSGDLRPGDRIASVQQLMRSYRVSQRVIVAAVDELARSGDVVTRPRSGTFVAERTQMGTQGGAADGEQEGRVQQVRLHIATDEMYAGVLRAMGGAFDTLHRRSPHCTVEPTTGVGTGLAALLESRHVDLIHTQPAALQRLGTDRIAPLTDLDLVGLSESDLAPMVRSVLPQSAPLLGVPWSMAVYYMYVNLDVLAQAKVSQAPTCDWREIFSRAMAVDAAQPDGSDVVGLSIVGLRDWLLMCGALRLEGETLVLHTPLARELFAAYQEGGFGSVPTYQVMDNFVAGRSAFCHHCSFSVHDLQDAPFRWAAWPIPAVAGATIPAKVTMLAVNRRTPHVQECLDAIRFLCERGPQEALGGLHGNLPARADALAASAATRPAHLPTLEEAMAGSSLVWGDRLPESLSSASRLDRRLLDGTITPDQAVHRLVFALNLLDRSVAIRDSAAT